MTRRRQGQDTRDNAGEASNSGASRLRSERSSKHSVDASEPRFNRGITALCVLIGIVSAICILRLIDLQVVKAEEYSRAAAENQLKQVVLPARRGTIYDRNGNVLALSVDCKTIYSNSNEVHDPSAVASLLAKHLGGSPQDYLSTLTNGENFSYIERRVDEEVAEALANELSENLLTGIGFIDDTKRIYPYGDVGGQIVGLINIDGEGQSGLELTYDEILSGTDGSMAIARGAGGTPIAGGSWTITEPENGQDIVISLDINLQQDLERIVQEAQENAGASSASSMILDPKSGEILAACSTPFATITNRETLDVSGLNLRAVSDSYEPGSIFKVVTLSIGVENGSLHADDIYHVPAQYLVGEDYVSDADSRYEAMDMTVREILRRSSNVGTSLLVENVIGAQEFAEGVERLGIGTSTGIDFPGEATGLVKSYDEYDGSTAGSMSFGQGVAVPVIQIIRVYAAIANEGVALTPHFLISIAGEQKDWGEGERILSASTTRVMTDMMRTVVSDGTGTNAQVVGYDVAGKTGTGEMAQSNDSGYEESLYVSSFCGFANAYDPELLVYMGLNGTAYGSHLSAEIFSTIMGEAVEELHIAPAY